MNHAALILPSKRLIYHPVKKGCMYRIFLMMLLSAACFAAPVGAFTIDNTFSVSFEGYDSSAAVSVYPNGSCVQVPLGSTIWIGVTQYPGGTWDTDIPNMYPTKATGKEIIQMRLSGLQGIYTVTYKVPGTYYTMGAPQVMTLHLNIGDVGGDSYEASLYAQNPQQYRFLTSDEYPRIKEGGTVGQFTFGDPYNTPYIRTISVTTTGMEISRDAKIILVPQQYANPIPVPSQPYWSLYDVKVQNIPATSLEEVDIVFGVPRGVVTDAGFDPRYDIELLRFSDNYWEKLETSYVGEGEGQRAGLDWYATKSPGFSYYAVGFAENVTKLPEEVFGTPTPTATVQVVTEVPTTASTTVPTSPQQSPSWAFSVLLAAAGVACLCRR